MNQPLLRPLGFGEILDGAFTLYRRNFPTFALTSLVGMGIVMVGFAVFGGSLLIAAAGGMGNGGAAAGDDAGSRSCGSGCGKWMIAASFGGGR